MYTILKLWNLERICQILHAGRNIHRDDISKRWYSIHCHQQQRMFAKDTSKKIRAVYKAKGEGGSPLCTNPPYRYV